jgi:hypothetical protein
VSTAVHFFHDGDGFVVRGTLDPQEALALAVAELDEHYPYGDLLYGVAPQHAGQRDDYEIEPAAVAAMADRCHEWLRTARPGLYRMRPASTSDRDAYGVAWWLQQATQRGRGVWQGVEFRC